MILEPNYDAKPSAYICILQEWTKEPPTQEGWYWVRGPRDGFMIVQYYNKKRVIKALIAGAGGNIHYGELKLITHWLGPLPVPEPPTKEG
jgi:hypothetical protein